MHVFFDDIIEQFETWLVSGLVLSLDLTLSSIGSSPGEFLETWRFSIQSHVPDGKSSKYEIDSETLSSDMSKLLHSIDHSCSFLVGIPQNCKFDLDVYCDPSASASESWTNTTGNVLSLEKGSVRSIKVCPHCLVLVFIFPMMPCIFSCFNIFYCSWIRRLILLPIVLLAA